MLIIIVILKLIFIKNASCENVSLLNDSDNKPFSIEANLYTMRTKICGIYKITNPKNKIYIGQSIDIEKRKRRYETLFCNGQQRIYRSILKYGWNKHKFEIIHICNREELNDLERYYIDLFQTNRTANGLNLSTGGQCPSYESRKKGAIKIANALRGRKHSKERIEKARIGIIKSQYKHNEETKKKLSIIRSKKINQYDSNYNLIKQWPSALSATKHYGLGKNTITSAIKYGRFTINYFWNYFENPLSKEKQSENRRKTQDYVNKNFPYSYRKSKGWKL